jgi:type I restriction enzyme S subunit
MIFYKETDFQETPVGKIPSDWSISKLGGLVEVETGKRAKGGGLAEGNVASIGGEHIDIQGRIIWNGMKFIPDDFYDSLKKGKVKLGDILLVKDGATTGKVAFVRDLKYEKVAVNEHVFVIRSRTEHLVNDFLFFFLFSKYGQSQIKKRFHGIIGGIIRDDLETISLPIPPLNEQKGIVGVLGVVDSAIELVDRVIWKTERLKKGLMQTLLTRGIGHKEYKQTPIGTTPKTWKVVKLQDVAEIRSNRSINDFEKIAFIPMELIPESQIFAKYQIRAKKDVKSFTYCKAGDLLLAKITPSLENGKQGIVPPDVPNKVALATTEVFPICCKEINRFFLFYVLKFSKFRNKIISSMTGTTGRQRASKEGVKRLEIPLPPLNEQMKIAEILSNVDRKLELEKNERARLECIKQGLMNLLLTGRIRVKVD